MIERMKRVFNPCDECNYSYSKNNEVTNVCKRCEFNQYRKLEEQGLLLKLPCKVGDKAYHIIEDNMADPPIYISEHEIQDVSAKAVYFADDWWSFEEMREMNAYLNKAEAEKALAKLSEVE